LLMLIKFLLRDFTKTEVMPATSFLGLGMISSYKMLKECWI
jgi:hypothetical protein